MTKRRQAKTCNIGVVNNIKDNDKNIPVQDENTKDRWRECSDELFNGEHGHVGEHEDFSITITLHQGSAASPFLFEQF